MLPSIESLRCFATAAKLLNFRAAARSVALTPAAFGQRIKQLEDQLGVSLFQRTTRSVRLTDAGLSMLPHAEKCLLSAGECTRVGRGDLRLAALDIVIGTRHELGVSWLLPQIDALTRAQPSAQIHLYFGSGSDLLLRVRTMEIDCAVTSTRFTDPKLDSVRLHREDYVFVGSRALGEASAHAARARDGSRPPRHDGGAAALSLFSRCGGGGRAVVLRPHRSPRNDRGHTPTGAFGSRRGSLTRLPGEK